MTDWRIDSKKVRAALANNTGESPLVSTARLRLLGYQSPDSDQADAQARDAHRDDHLLARSRRYQAEDAESVA